MVLQKKASTFFKFFKFFYFFVFSCIFPQEIDAGWHDTSYRIKVSEVSPQFSDWQLAQNRLGFVQVIYCFHFLYCETDSAKCSSISVIFLLSSKQIFCRFSEFSACADTSSVVADRLDIWSTIFALLSCKFTQSL